MAGVKGKSGGARPGAGRKPKLSEIDGDTPLAILMAFAKDQTLHAVARIRAAGLAAPYLHQKLGDGGKKESAQRSAAVAAGGRFGAGAPPKLAAVNGKAVND